MLLLILIFKLVKKNSSSEALVKIGFIKNIISKAKYVFPFLLLLSSAEVKNENSLEERISFSVNKNNNSIGFINVKKTSLNQITTYTISSEVNARVVFKFKAQGKEKSVYKNDTLIFSSVYRKINKKIKLNQSLSLVDGTYFLTDKDKKDVLNIDLISRNLVTLFFIEPIDVDSVYCDKLNKMLNISKIGKDKYKVAFTNNSYNIFHYKKGKCSMVEVVGSFYKVKLIPTDHQILIK